ncbi:MAG TPA: hypothetical protein VHO02_08850 [Fibrobacteria bacterium]|nr:hypothetical protein [Fibrobacteria bacterium]
MIRCALVLTSLLLAGCLFRTEEGQPRKPIRPFAVGNSWVYVDSGYYGGDSIRIDSTRIDVLGSRELVIGGDTRTAYLLNTWNRAAGTPGPLTTFVQDRPDGEHTLGAMRDTATFLFETLHVKHPAKRGERYITYFPDLRLEGDTWIPVLDTVEIEVGVRDTVCVMPAGTFTCNQYFGRRGGVLFARTWYAPGVGYLGADTWRMLEVNGEQRLVTFHKRLAYYVLR